jgi:hypothetical protein
MLPEGRVQLRFHSSWTDVCADGMDSDQVDRLCARLGHGQSGRILPISDQKPTTITWLAHCFVGECRPIRIQQPCAKGILNVRCEKEDSSRFFLGLFFSSLKFHYTNREYLFITFQ